MVALKVVAFVKIVCTTRKVSTAINANQDFIDLTEETGMSLMFVSLVIATILIALEIAKKRPVAVSVELNFKSLIVTRAQKVILAIQIVDHASAS